MSDNSAKRGKFIDFEYLDGGVAGEYIKRIATEFFPNHGILYEKEPTDGPFGGPINNIISDRAKQLPNWRALAHGFLADRFDHINKNTDYGIRSSLERGDTYIGDRYNLSTYAYQIPQEEFDWFYTCSQEILIPDLTIYLKYNLDSCVRTAAEDIEHSILFRQANEDKEKFRSNLEKTEAKYMMAIEFLRKKPGWKEIHIIEVGSVNDTWAELKPLVKNCLGL